MALFLVSTKLDAVLGSYVKAGENYRFISWTQNGTSRKAWPTPAAATPRAMRGDTKIVEAATAPAALILAK